MSVKIDIVPIVDTLDMFDEPDTSSNYALCGHVSLSITPSRFSSFFSTRTRARLLLRSLSITFEGQCEVINPKTGYIATRICTVTRELVSSWRELSSGDLEEEDRWDVVYNLPIPGWLPATSHLGYESDVGVRYGIFASAEFTSLDGGGGPHPWSFLTVCTPFPSRDWTTSARKEIAVRRLMIPPPPQNQFPDSHFLVGTDVPTQRDEQESAFPEHVLRHIQVLATVPAFCSIEDSSIPLTLRFRGKSLQAEHASRVEINRVTVDISQVERCKYRTSSEFASRFPLPSDERQPPNEPLLNPHPISTMFELGFYSLPSLEGNTHRHFSLLPESSAGRFSLPDKTRPFVDESNQTRSGWYSLDIKVPFSKSSRNKSTTATDWVGDTILRPSQLAPLFYIRHELKISLHLSYTCPTTSEVSMRKVQFVVPVRFAHVLASPSPRQGTRALPVDSDLDLAPNGSSSSSSADEINVPLLSMPEVMPYAQTMLPAYSHLYHSNGERRVDYSDFLPVYSPPEGSQHAVS